MSHCACTGVHLSLKGAVYDNNSAIQITEIGETIPDTANLNDGLQCITDSMPCCAGARLGQWYFPDRTRVPVLGMATTFYRNRGNDGTVNLNHFRTDVLMPTGLAILL
jgi:hypothetical protein